MKCESEVSTDFISDLPPSVLHHVLSYLSFEEAVRTSVLSKQWNSVQKSFPILAFLGIVGVREYLASIDRRLQNFVHDKLSIERLKLMVINIDPGSIPLVNTWLPLALHNGVSYLMFHVVLGIENIDIISYPLPETTFTVNTSLLSCSSSKFFLLRKLELYDVCLTEKVVQDIICNCPNITDLGLWYFKGLKTLSISNRGKLTSLDIVATIDDDGVCFLQSIFVDAPSLQLVHIEYFAIEPVSPCEIDLISCYNLRELKIVESPVTDTQLNMHISRFPLLEVLSISWCSRLRRLRIDLPRLKRLELKNCELEDVELDAPMLSEVIRFNRIF